MKNSRKMIVILIAILGLATLSCSEDNRSAQEIGIVAPKHFTLSDKSLKIEVWATSPLLHNPTGMDVDHLGNVWVTEAVNYRTYNHKNKGNPKYEEGDRVNILIDTDQDGEADESKIFVQDKDLVAPSGLAVLDNKIYVSSSPNLIVYTDINRNMVFDEGDKKEIFLTGFGGLDHDHSLHKIEAGPDGRLYVNTGNAGPHIITDRTGFTLRSSSTYKGGSPYNVGAEPTMLSDDGRVYNAGFIMSIKEDGTDMKMFGHNFRNPWGHSIDSFGDIWMNDNDDTLSCRTTWIMRNANLGYTGFRGAEGWGVGQRPGQSVPTAHWRQDDPGVIPSGHIYKSASPTGIVYWEVGDGMLLSCEAGQNVIWGYKRQKNGAGFKMEEFAFLSSTGAQTNRQAEDVGPNATKKWFRPSDIVVGTDGSLFVADWFDSKVGGHRQNDRRASGTIYRISPKRSKFKSVKYDFSTLAGSIDALKSPAVHVRYIARKKIIEAGTQAIDGLKKLYNEGNKFEKGRTLFLLDELGEKSFVEKALFDKDSDIAIAAYRALEQNSKDVLPLAKLAIESQDIALRREIAVSLRDVPFVQSKELILDLISSYDGKDRWYVEAIGQACDGKESQIYKILKKDPKTWDAKHAGIMWRLHPKESVNDFKVRAMDKTLDELSRKKAIDALAFIHTKESSQAMLQIAKSAEKLSFLQEYTFWWLHNRKSTYWKKYLANVDIDRIDPFVGEEKLLIKSFEKNQNSHSIDKLLATENGSKYLIDKVRNKQLSRNIKYLVSKKLLAHKDESIRSLANIYFGKNKNKKSGMDVDAVKAIKGDAKNGKNIFYSKGACFTCHAIDGEGGAIGPELSQVKTKFDQAGLIDSIINPSSDILIGYESVSITLKDGTTLSGMLESENGPVVIRSAIGQKQEIALSDISKKEISSVSIMPSAASIGLNNQELADIVAYLFSIQ